MTGSNYRRYLLPVALGVLGLLLLLRIFVVDGSILIPEDADVVLLVALLGVAIVAAIRALVRTWMDYLYQMSARRARRETLAEHVRFLGRLDHELKNPLTALRAGLSTLALTGLDEQQQALVEAMETETVRLSGLVADLRKLAEMEAQPLDRRPVDVAAFVAGVLQHERERFEEGGRALHSAVEGAPPAWTFDEDLLALAVHNLLDNAFKHTRPGDTVRLEANVRDELAIAVADSGVGIPAEALPHIWEELYRAERPEKTPGSGIGLALVKAIVERHDGTVDVQSHVGQGTTVTLRLPAPPPSP